MLWKREVDVEELQRTLVDGQDALEQSERALLKSLLLPRFPVQVAVVPTYSAISVGSSRCVACAARRPPSFVGDTGPRPVAIASSAASTFVDD